MIHIPRPTIPGAVLILGLAAALVAPGATGRSQAAPVQQQEPVISGQYLLQVGSTIHGNDGKWSGTQPITFAHQWMRCNPDANGCNPITNATGTSYKIVNADVGHTIRFRVTAKNSDGSTKGLSNATQEIAASPQEPAATAAPTISGSAVVGQTLTADPGTWRGTQPITFTYTWESCTADLLSCKPNGGHAKTYTIASSDAGRRINVKVVGKNSVGQNSAHALPTDTVTQSGGGGGGGTISVGDVGPAGDRLVVDQVQFSPNPVSSRSQPIDVRIRVRNTKGKLVRGAMVSIQSTPVVASIPTPQPTGDDGGVTYTIHPESDFPLKNGYSVQFFVKAYKQGDPTLAGISGTRLVQVKTVKP